MASPHPDPKGAWKPKPSLSTPSSFFALEIRQPRTPHNRTAPQSNNEPLHQISIRYSTIAARALSFQGQAVTGITPLRLAQNGLYYRLYPGFGGTACCFTCQSATPLNAFQRASIQAVQQLHKVDCIWQIICSDLKPHFESPETLPHSLTPSPQPRQSVPSLDLSSDTQPLEPTTSGSHTQSANQPTPTVAIAGTGALNTNFESSAEPSSTAPDRASQLPQPAGSPQPSEPSSTATPSLQRQPTYASVLQKPTTSTPQPKPRSHQSVHPPRNLQSQSKIFTAAFIISRRHLSLKNEKKKRSKTTSATQSLSKILNSALPALSRYLAEMQPTADNCWPPYLGTCYSRPTRAA